MVVDKTQHYKTISKTCYAANFVYLFLHLFYLVLFLVAKTYIMAYVDAGVIVVYLLFFLMLKKKKYYLYALSCGNLYFAFIITATTMLGFATGFHFYLIGLCVVSFFTTYFQESKNFKGTLVWVGLSLAIYLTLYFVTKYNAPYYAIEPWLETTLFTTHAVVVFGFITSYLLVFVRYALSLEKKIMSESRTDELTQMHNRYALYDYFDQTKEKSGLVLALFDIDDFKAINDRYGHVTGDEVLKKMSELAAEILADAFVCRYGGEEFVIVLQEQGAFQKLEALRQAVAEQTFDCEGNPTKITITIGVAKYVKDASLEKWVDLADEKMYIGKGSGKNQTVI